MIDSLASKDNDTLAVLAPSILWRDVRKKYALNYYCVLKCIDFKLYIGALLALS